MAPNHRPLAITVPTDSSALPETSSSHDSLPSQPRLLVYSQAYFRDRSLPGYLIKGVRGLDVLTTLKEARQWEDMGYTASNVQSGERVDLAKERCADVRCRCEACVREGKGSEKKEERRKGEKCMFREVAEVVV